MNNQFVIAALYRFVRLDHYRDLQQPLLDLMLSINVRGTLLLASEGINGTIAGSNESVSVLLDFLRQDPALSDLDCKLSYDTEMPFYRSRVKLKKEIVTMGVEGIDPARSAGQYVKPEDWNALISDPSVTLIDTRNDYESAIGSFDRAQIPNTRSFRDFPGYVEKNLDPAQHRKIAMFCTGGIRCEKSTAYLKQQGYDEVYHLQGGVLKYLETVPEQDSLWQGECFVFDNRVSVNHALEKGSYDQCHACRLPITEADKSSDKYVQGVSCSACFDAKTDQERARYQEREHQLELARQRGEPHIGTDAKTHASRRKSLKDANKAAQRKGEN
ncbi:MAG: UPF0176 protein [Planctomycetota bacterium]|jgi:UPF0176 protein